VAIERENQVVKPNFLAAGWVKKGTAATGSFVEEHLHDGTTATARSFKAVCPGSATSEGGEAPAASFVPVLKPSTKFTVSIWVWVAEADAGKKIQGLFQEQTSGGGFIANQITAEKTLVAGFNQLTLTATSAATAAKLSAQVYSPAKVALTMWISSAMLEYAATAGGYFDGANAPAGKKTGWSGTANESTSYLEPASKTLSLTDSTTPTESLTKKATKGLSDSASPTETFTKKARKALADSTSPTETLTKQLAKGLADTATTSESWSFELIEPEPVVPRVVINREHPPSKLAVLARAKDGTPVARWAEDESKLENVLGSLGKSGDMPGGHTELSGALPRDPTKSYPDLALFSDVELQGAGGERLWTGGIRQEPEDGERQTIEVKAVGDKQFLEDDETVVGPGFIDGDLTKWVDPSSQRRANLLSGGVSSANVSTETGWQDAGATPPSIAFQFQSFTTAVEERGEAWYSGGGVDIGALYFDFLPSNGASESWYDIAGFSSDDILTAFELEGSGLGTPALTEWALTAKSTGLKYALVVTAFKNAAYEGEAAIIHFWRNLRVLGRHGLTFQGVWPNVGFFAKQMIPFIVEGSGLTTKDELLDDDEFIIPQAWFSDPATRMSKLVEVTKYGLLDWFVFNDRVLQYRKPATYGRKWRLSPGSGTPKNAGQDANRVIDGITVSWQDVDGTTKTIGPAGSGAQYLDNRLLVTDERNAAVAAGRPRRKMLALNGVCTAELALRVGMRFLEEAANLAQSGEATISGYCQDSYGIWWPAAYVQPGDWAADPGTQNYRKITSCNYSHDSKSASVTLGAPPQGIEALESRMNAKLIELGLG